MSLYIIRYKNFADLCDVYAIYALIMYQSRIRNNKRGRQQKKREFVEIEDGQMYGIVQDLLGNGRVNVFCEDKTVKIARIRGSMRKYSNKVLIEKGDLVLVALRDFHDDKVDLFHKYISEDVAYLMRHDMLPEAILKKLQNGNDLMNEDGKDREDANYVLFMADEESAGSRRTSFMGSSAPSDKAGDSEELDIDAI